METVSFHSWNVRNVGAAGLTPPYNVIGCTDHRGGSANTEPRHVTAAPDFDSSAGGGGIRVSGREPEEDHASLPRKIPDSAGQGKAPEWQLAAPLLLQLGRVASRPHITV